MSDAAPALRRAPAPLALMALIFVLSGRSDPGPDLGAWANVVAHVTEYAALAALWAWALAPSTSRPLLWAAALSFAYALTDEWHQSFVPGREADPLDIAIDSLGISLALLAISRGARSRHH